MQENKIIGQYYTEYFALQCVNNNFAALSLTKCRRKEAA